MTYLEANFPSGVSWHGTAPFADEDFTSAAAAKYRMLTTGAAPPAQAKQQAKDQAATDAKSPAAAAAERPLAAVAAAVTGEAALRQVPATRRTPEEEVNAFAHPEATSDAAVTAYIKR